MGQRALIKVDAYPDTLFEGKVYRVSPVVDTKTRSAAIEILADNAAGHLKSGMFSEVRLVVGSREGAVAVPASAVISDAGKTYVFVPVNDTAMRREIKTGIANDSVTQISSGLRAGDELITFGLYGLKDGSKIKVQN
jgi:RND family efflux transporter MFP subunit